ncbi:unnamed protein product [Cunninghamella blakesleeana]
MNNDDTENEEKQKYQIGLRVDGRFISVLEANLNVDLSTIEAAKSMNEKKISDDKLKLIIESKIIMNEFIDKCPMVDPNNVKIYSIQISGYKAEICTLKLVDNGLYVYTLFKSIPLPNSPDENVEQIQMLSTEFSKDKRQSFGEHFNRKSGKNLTERSKYKYFTRGSYFPLSTPVSKNLFPKFLYKPYISGDSSESENDSHKNKKGRNR